MAAIVQDKLHGEVRPRKAASRDELVAEILPGLDDAEAVWRSLTAAPDCLATPYQQFGWCAAYLRASGEDRAARVAILRDRIGRVRMLLPLVLRRRHGLVLACTVGDAHANYHLPVFSGREAASVAADEVRAALAAAGRSAGIDAFLLSHQPRVWEGALNPLALGGEPERSDAYGLALGPDADATVQRVFSADARKKLKSKERRLTEALGPVEVRMAGDAAETRAALAAFYVQKSARFSAMGVADPYEPESVRRFLDAAAAGTDPSIALHVLRVAATGRILAVFGGAVNATRYSGMMTSFDADPAIGRYSPGDLLLYHLLRDQTARGRLGFDLGIGEARYKASICDETILLVETVLPVTGRGHLFALLRSGLQRLKRRIKDDPRLFAAASRLRTLVARVRRGGSGGEA